MLRIYDEMEWRGRRRVILLSVFVSGAVFGSLTINATPAGSDDRVKRPLQNQPAPAEGACVSQTRLRMACRLESVPR